MFDIVSLTYCLSRPHLDSPGVWLPIPAHADAHQEAKETEPTKISNGHSFLVSLISDYLSVRRADH